MRNDDGAADSISGNGFYATQKSGNDIIVTIEGLGSIVLAGAASSAVIKFLDDFPVPVTAGPGDDYICNFRSNEKIVCGSGSDVIGGFSCHYGGYSFIVIGGDGNDVIYNYCQLEDYSINEDNGEAAYIRENARRQNDNRSLKQQSSFQKRKQFHGRRRRR